MVGISWVCRHVGELAFDRRRQSVGVGVGGKDQGVHEDKELDAASLGMLLRRGLKRGAAAARPLAGGSPAAAETPTLSDVGHKQVLNEFGNFGVWEEPRRKFGEIATRAIGGVERLVVSEVLEQMRAYTMRRWDQQDEEEPLPTPSLVPALAIFSSHLGHLCSILDRETLLPMYRRIANSISSALVERVVMSGGSKRFDHAGGLRFGQDLKQGWLGVVQEVAAGGKLGRKPETAWKVALDAAVLLGLPGGESGDEVTLAKVVKVVFDAEEGIKGREYDEVLEKLGHIDDGKVNVKEVLRRRVEVWK